tara:strand:+ start:152 stop:1123 length:972 start_codon:yes stop_codon:yes gene_type:complete
VSGWLLIIFLLLLGGLISSFGDLLGTKIGKARFTIFKLRPRKTATLITIITGSLISASSLFLMLLVNSQLRVGLFRLGDLQKKLQESRKLLFSLKFERKTLEGKIIQKEKELTQLERNIFALRSGKVVISSGQSIFISEIQSDKRLKIDSQIEKIINNANRFTQKKVNPNIDEPRNILLLRKNHIDELKKTISKGGDWVVNIKSVRNVLQGENYVYAFPELTKNKIIVLEDEIISKAALLDKENNITDVRKKINFLLASSLAEAKRRGSLVNEIKLKSDSVKKLQKYLKNNKGFDFEFELVSMRDSKTAQPVIVELEVSKLVQ